MENKDVAVETNEPKKEFIPKLKFNINLNTKDLWLFSMYHSYKGLQGIFNVVFTVLWLYLLIAQYSELTFARKVLYLVFVMMFSVIQPMLLYLKSANQARSKAIKGGFLLGISDEGLQISKEEASGIFKWEDIFKNLEKTFPNSKLGIGECGNTAKNATNQSKIKMINHYYTMPKYTPNYVGGYFWWYWVQDCIPYKNNEVWSEIYKIMKN